MRRRLILSLLATSALVLSGILPTSAAATPPATLAEVVGVDLGTLGGDETIPLALNDRGQVVGLSRIAGDDVQPNGPFHAFLWQDGVMTDLTPTDGASEARDINNRGQIIGSGSDGYWLLTRGQKVLLPRIGSTFVNDRTQIAGGFLGTPYFWERGVVTPLAPVPGSPPVASYPEDLSERGAVLGRGIDPADDAGNSLPTLQPAFVWADDVFRRTPDLFPDAAINKRGDVAGTGAQGGLIWRGGVTTLLGAPRGATSTKAVALNDRRQVAGTAMVGGQARAFVWRNGHFTDLRTPAGVQTTAGAINENGAVAGLADFVRPADGQNLRGGFLARRGTMTLLRTPDDTRVDTIVDVNDRGLVLGKTISFPQRAIVWTVPGRSR